MPKQTVIEKVFGEKETMKLMEVLKGLKEQKSIDFDPSAQSPDPGFTASFKLRKALRTNNGEREIAHKPVSEDDINAAGAYMRNRRWYVRKAWAVENIAWLFETAKVDAKL